MTEQKLEQADTDMLELAFACHICGKTISDLYLDLNNIHALHDGTKEESGVIYMLWLTECDHIICRYHVPRGEHEHESFDQRAAVPARGLEMMDFAGLIDFYPEGRRPRVHCPKCAPNGVRNSTDLFWIRGFQEGVRQGDPQILLRCSDLKDGERSRQEDPSSADPSSRRHSERSLAATPAHATAQRARAASRSPGEAVRNASLAQLSCAQQTQHYLGEVHTSPSLHRSHAAQTATQPSSRPCARHLL